MPTVYSTNKASLVEDASSRALPKIDVVNQIIPAKLDSSTRDCSWAWQLVTKGRNCPNGDVRGFCVCSSVMMTTAIMMVMVMVMTDSLLLRCTLCMCVLMF